MNEASDAPLLPFASELRRRPGKSDAAYGLSPEGVEADRRG